MESGMRTVVENMIEYTNPFTDIKNRIPNFWTQTNDPDDKLIKTQLKYKFYVYLGIIVFCIILVIFISNMGEKPPSTNMIYLLSFFCFLIFVLLILQLYNLYNDNFSKYKIIMLCLALIIVFLLFYYYNTKYDFTFQTSFKYVLVFLFFIVIIALAIFYRIFLLYLKKQQGITGIIINLIFFIPCLVNDVLEYFKNQFNITTNTTFLLLLIEFIILFFYFYLYSNFIHEDDYTCIMKDPVHLKDKHVIADNNVSAMSSYVPYYFNLGITQNKYDWSTIKQINNYSVSFWVYMNQNNDGASGEHNIFNFGGGVSKGRPTVTYTSEEHLYKVYSGNSDVITVSNVPNQRWNYFAIVYYGTGVYLYINGNLDNYKDNIAHLTNSIENIIIGQDNGLHGAICNVHYYNKPLRKNEIAKTYNLLRLNNPPI